MALNEFGERLDRNGYAPSIFVFEKHECWLCHEYGDVERHEIFGAALRDKSKALGLWVNLCGGCHRTRPDAVHQSGKTAFHIKNIAQRKAMTKYGWDEAEWKRRFFKSYLNEEDSDV